MLLTILNASMNSTNKNKGDLMMKDILIVVLAIAALFEGGVIFCLVENRASFAKKIKDKYLDKNVARKEKGYLTKISDLYEEVERLEKQLVFHKDEIVRWKSKAHDYAYAMQDVAELYGKACGTISDYLREGLLVKSFSQSKSAYEDFHTTWKDLQDRRFIDTYKFQEILDNPNELEYLFGTSDMNVLTEVFNLQN